VAFLFAAAFVALCGGSRADTALPDLRTVAESLHRQESALSSLCVKYRVSSRCLGSAADVNQYLHIVYLENEVQAFAFKGDKRYGSFERTNSLADRLITTPRIVGDGPALNVEANRINAFDGKVIRRRLSGGWGADIIGLNDRHNSSIFQSEYVDLLSRRLPSAFDSKNRPSMDCLSSKIDGGRCRMRPALEAVNGAPCVVIEADGGDQVEYWCDRAMGYAIRKFVVYYASSKQIHGQVTASDFTQVCDGVWLLRKAELELFADKAAPTRLHDVAIFANNFEVLDIHANDVPDELFALRIPAGAFVIDYVHGGDTPDGHRYALTYEMPADEHDLDRTIDAALHGQHGARAQTRSSTPYIVWASVVVVVFLVTAIIAWRIGNGPATQGGQTPPSILTRRAFGSRVAVLSVLGFLLFARVVNWNLHSRKPAHQISVALVEFEHGDAKSVEDIRQILNSDDHFHTELIKPADTQGGLARKFDVLIFPGGSGSKQSAALGVEGRKVVREFIHSGGGFVGICAGGFLASAGEDCDLGLINAKTLSGVKNIPGWGEVSIVTRHAGPVQIGLTSVGKRFFETSPDAMEVLYSGGPIFIPGAARNLPNCLVLADFRTETASLDVSKGKMLGTPAIIAGIFGKGHVVAVSPHIEDSAGTLVKQIVTLAADGWENDDTSSP